MAFSPKLNKTCLKKKESQYNSWKAISLQKPITIKK